LKENYLTISNIAVEALQMKKLLQAENLRKRDWECNINKVTLLVSDMQQYFTDRKSHAHIPSADAIISNINVLIDKFHQLKRPVIFTRHINTPEDACMMKVWWNDLIDPDSNLSEINPRLKVGASEIIMKNQYDAFHGTPLESLLRETGSEQLVVCGVMTNLCCETTVRSAFVKGFNPIMPLDATATYNKEMHMATYRNLAFGFSPPVLTSELLEMLAQ